MTVYYVIGKLRMFIAHVVPIEEKESDLRGVKAVTDGKPTHGT